MRIAGPSLPACVLSAWLLGSGALASPPSDALASPPSDAAERVEDALLRARAVAQSEAGRSGRLEALRAVSRALFDTRAMGQLALGPTLRERPAVQQAEFLALFDEFIVRAYLQKMLFFRDPEFVMGRPVVRGDDVVVHTILRTRKDDFFVDYTMRRQRAEWFAVDVAVEGVSLARNHGEQFRALLRGSSFEELLDRMRVKVARLRGEALREGGP